MRHCRKFIAHWAVLCFHRCVAHVNVESLKTIGLNWLSRCSKYFEPLPCKCKTGETGVCGYSNMCRNSIVVCKVKCSNTGKVCIGNTKKKIQTNNDAALQWSPKTSQTWQKSDSYTKHFATQFHDSNPSIADQCEGITCSIIWQGNSISVVKTFATKTVPCVLKKECNS